MESATARPLERTDRLLQAVFRRGRSDGLRSRRGEIEHDRIRPGRIEAMDGIQDLGTGRDVGGRRAEVLPHNRANPRRRYVFPRS